MSYNNCIFEFKSPDERVSFGKLILFDNYLSTRRYRTTTYTLLCRQVDIGRRCIDCYVDK